MVDWKLCIDSPQKRALDLYGGSLTEGSGYVNGWAGRVPRRRPADGWGDGYGYGDSAGDDDGEGWGDGFGDGDGYGNCYGDGWSSDEW